MRTARNNTEAQILIHSIHYLFIVFITNTIGYINEDEL